MPKGESKVLEPLSIVNENSWEEEKETVLFQKNIYNFRGGVNP